MNHITETELPARSATAFVMASDLNDLCVGVIEHGGTVVVSEPVDGGFLVTASWPATPHPSMAKDPAAREGRRGRSLTAGRWV